MKARFVALSIVILFACTMVLGSFFTVDQGERGIVLRWGSVTRIASPGLSFKIPFMDDVIFTDVKTRKISLVLDAYTIDTQAVKNPISLNYSINEKKVGEIYAKYGLDFEKNFIIPQIQSIPKNIFGTIAAADMVGKRAEMTKAIDTELKSYFAESGFIIESFQVEDINFSAEYETAVEKRMVAQIAVQEAQQLAEKEIKLAEVIANRAEGDAKALKKNAEAKAEAIRLEGNATAEIAEKLSNILSRNPAYVKYLEAQKWDGKLPSTMIPGGSLPIITMPKVN